MGTQPLSEVHKANFETLQRAFQMGHTAILSGRRKADGQPVVLLVTVSFDGEEYMLTPFAEMIDGNPFQLYDPPAQGERANENKEE